MWGGGNGDEDNFAVTDAFRGGGGEFESSGIDVPCDQLSETGLIDGNFPVEEHLDLLLIVVDAGDFVTDFCEASAGGEADVSGANDGEFHRVGDRPRGRGEGGGYQDRGGAASDWKCIGPLNQSYRRASVIFCHSAARLEPSGGALRPALEYQ